MKVYRRKRSLALQPSWCSRNRTRKSKEKKNWQSFCTNTNN